MKRALVVIPFALSLAVGCTSSHQEARPPGRVSNPPAPPVNPAKPHPEPRYVADLRAGQFGAAEGAATEALAKNPSDATAAAVCALTRYLRVAAELADDFGKVIEEADDHGKFDHEGMRETYQRTEQALAEVERDLAVAVAAADFELTLCMACWEYDWNHNQRIDEGDLLLFQLELDAAGEELPEGDPRRKPTFRFDQGDLYWARAMVAFQRALLQLIVAYRWDDLDQLLFEPAGSSPPKITIRLDDPERVKRARALILEGLDHADQARTLYLAETDDDREWVPSPRQQNHPLPLPVDEGLYATWQGVIGDVRGLLDGGQGISVREAMLLIDDDWPSLPTGFIDVGGLFARPRDLVLDFALFKRLDRQPNAANIEAVLRSMIGDGYAQTMKPSPLVERLGRMKRDLERGDDSLDRKLRYLLWLN